MILILTLIVVALATVLSTCVKPKPERELPKGCNFGFELSKDKRAPQTDEEINAIAQARKGPTCNYVYSAWSPCVDGIQTRTVISSKPKNCSGTPILEQPCGVTPPPPTGNKVLFIDFDGHIVTGTNWNYMPEIVCASSGLTLEEQLTIMAQIQIDYDPFDVIVTSDEAVYNAAQANKRMRCIVTESYEWYGQAGGVAYVNSFTWGNDTPCFVFSSLLGYSVKKIHEASSHELGHTIGLYHQARYDENCIKLSDYNTGCCGEAPIMGVAYNQPVGKWWVGPNSQGCTVIQDDVAKLKQVLGLK